MGIFSTNSFYYHLVVLALQCAGFLVTANNPHYIASELEHQLEDSEAQFVLVHPECLNTALVATKALGWSEARQKGALILAVKRVDTEWDMRSRQFILQRNVCT